MTEWVTIKIPKQIRDDAREDSRTYGEIMQAGLNDDRVTTTGDDPLAMYEDFREVVTDVVQESLEAWEPGTKDNPIDEERLDRLEDAVKEATNAAQSTDRKLEELR